MFGYYGYGKAGKAAARKQYSRKVLQAVRRDAMRRARTQNGVPQDAVVPEGPIATVPEGAIMVPWYQRLNMLLGGGIVVALLGLAYVLGGKRGKKR